MFPVFAMEINIHMHTFTQAAEHFTQQGLLALRISIIGGIKLRQQSPCTQIVSTIFGSLPPMKDSPAKHFSYSVFIISAF